ncbi:MAG: hypothetical protein ACKOQ4_17325 [Mycobacterium sp.]
MARDDLEGRVTSLESAVSDIDRRLRSTQQEAAAARVLAGAADRDVAELRAEIRDFRQATVGSFNSLREDFVDLRARVESGFDQVDRGFAEMRGKFDATATGQQRIVELIETLIDKRNR